MKIALLTATTCLILLCSCKKESNSSLNNSNRVKSYSEMVSTPYGKDSMTVNLSYDASGRIISAVSASSPGDKFLFTYPSTSKYVMDQFNANVLSIHEDFFFNAQSLLDSTFQYNDTQDSTTEKYAYNSNQQLVKLLEYNYSKLTGAVLSNTTTYSYDANGNLVTTADSDGQVYTYEYYPDQVAVMPVITGNLNPNTTKKSNLVKKVSLTSYGNVEGSAVFTYTFDSQNRIISEKAVDTNGSVVVKTFTYF